MLKKELWYNPASDVLRLLNNRNNDNHNATAGDQVWIRAEGELHDDQSRGQRSLR